MKKQRAGVLDGAGERGDRDGELRVLGVGTRAVALPTARDPQHREDRDRRHHGRQQRQRELLLAREDPARESEAEGDQRERVDAGVEKAEVELALGDELGGHAEAMQNPGSDADARQRAPRDEHPASQLCPGDAGAHSLAATITAQEIFGIDDRAPRGDEAGL